jgi:hypothetical protein
MNREKLVLSVMILLLMNPFVLGFINPGDSYEPDPVELRQAKIGNSIFLVFLICAVFALLIVYFLEVRNRDLRKRVLRKVVKKKR